MIKNIGWGLIACFMLLLVPAEAAKPRVWKITSTSSGSVASSGGVGISASLTGWKQYLKLNFRGVSQTRGIDYELVFNGNGNEQGIFGSVKESEGNTGRSLFLGTCSHGACTSYKNINTLRLTVTFKMKNGTDLVKKYKVRY